uniref:Uncharacterized protein n=1 Tax=Glossina palpalis gambiensis TaxID=67801 RepID=A0A1B0C4N5_9MUSC
MKLSKDAIVIVHKIDLVRLRKCPFNDGLQRRLRVIYLVFATGTLSDKTMSLGSLILLLGIPLSCSTAEFFTGFLPLDINSFTKAFFCQIDLSRTELQYSVCDNSLKDAIPLYCVAFILNIDTLLGLRVAIFIEI